MKNKNYYNKKKNNKGALLFELLIVISLLTIILSFGSNAIFLSLKSNKLSAERDIAMSLAMETLDATRAVIEEDWQNIYSLTKGTQHYYPEVSNNKWILLSGNGSTTLNGVVYTKYVTINNISRDYSTRDIESIYSGSNDDPSTQKITVVVSWTGGADVIISGYFSRWKNKICNHSGWTNGATGNTVKDCADDSYDTKDADIDVSTGSILLQ